MDKNKSQMKGDNNEFTQDFFKQQGEQDKIIREQQKKRDYQDIDKVRQDLEKEEEQLKSFFSSLKKPTKDDPTVMRKQRYQEKMGAYKQALEGLELRKLMKNFWNYEPSTPEEIETLNLCREYTKKNMFMWSFAGLAVTGLTAFKNRRYFGFGMNFVSFCVGIAGGGIFGIIKSTEYTLRKLEGLGPDFSLGRLAINEIEDFRLDKKKKQNV